MGCAPRRGGRVWQATKGRNPTLFPGAQQRTRGDTVTGGRKENASWTKGTKNSPWRRLSIEVVYPERWWILEEAQN